MNTRPAPLSELSADNEVTAAGPSWPEVQPTTNLPLDLMVQHHLTGPTESDHAFGHLEVLAKQLACIQYSDQSLQNIRLRHPSWWCSLPTTASLTKGCRPSRRRSPSSGLWRS